MTRPATDRSGEEGYLLIGLVVACFLLLLALSVAAPRVAKELERDREVESEHRAQEYVRAIQLYYRKNSAYPTSIEQLSGSGTTGVAIGPGQVKYLRQAYKDPLTNGEYRLIHVNEALTEVKGFFGEPLTGMAPGAAGIGGTPAAAAAIGGSTPGSAVNSGGAGSTGGGFSLGPSGIGSGSGSTGTATGTGATGTGAGGTGTSTGTGTSGTSSTDATTFQGSKGGVVGVGSNAKGKGLVEWNGSEDIDKWEFLYDPRVEQLKQQVSLFGGSPATSGSGSLGGGFAPISGTSTPGSAVGPAGGGITGGSTPGSSTGTNGSSTGTTAPTQ
jgi:type II secretory pathway pseudopilin PulG